MQDLLSKAATLLEALPFIQKFSGETFVAKYGGSFIKFNDRSPGKIACVFPGSAVS